MAGGETAPKVLVVMVEPAIAQALRGSPPHSGPAARLHAAAGEAGQRLVPLHDDPGGDAELATHFAVVAPPGTDLEPLAAQFRSFPEVRAAYVKPTDEMP
ncbi:MAG TPA: hypothetical protein VFJ85_03325 [Acidimicrobiales bacterium]|nr:hypothetical protein [Acidimicrobiales bacterium]